MDKLSVDGKNAQEAINAIVAKVNELIPDVPKPVEAPKKRVGRPPKK